MGSLVILIVLAQMVVVYQGTLLHGQQQQQQQQQAHSMYNLQDRHVDHPSTKTKTTSATNMLPRILIGIIGNANNHMGKIYRWRHRKLLSLWNDARVCTLSDLQQLPSESTKHCQIIYTFVVGAYNETSGVPPILLDKHLKRPLTVDASQIPYQARYKDITNASDVTLLNIRENMNEGKTPTFWYWASLVGRQYQIPYLVKCDSDALLRLGPLLQTLYRSLPWPPRPTVLRALRHKAFWKKNATTIPKEAFWNDEYFAGMHLYLAGQLYLLSVDLVEVLVDEARKLVTPTSTRPYPYYLEGHEDHDASSMLQVASPHIPIRWLEVPRHFRFWEHPVKGDFWWKRIWKRESKKAENRKQAPTFSLVDNPDTPHASLLIILEATTVAQRKLVRTRLLAQRQPGSSTKRRLCSFLDRKLELQGGGSADGSCELFYVFVVGVENHPSRTTELLEDSALSLAVRTSSASSETDVLRLNIQQNTHTGMGPTILYWFWKEQQATRRQIDFLIFCRADVEFHFDRWFQIASVQSTPHPLLIGDVRDKYQEPREFEFRNESYWYHEYENIHIYLGSECFGISSSLVGGMVGVARNATKYPQARADFEKNLGHDLSLLAHYVPRTILQWVPIGKTLRFWSPLLLSTGRDEVV